MSILTRDLIILPGIKSIFNLQKNRKMAKSNKKISGKFGNEVYKAGKNGEYVSKVGKGPSETQLAALEPQKKRMPFINRLSSQLNRSVEYYDEPIAQSRLFHRLNILFFNQDENDTLLMLENIRGLEVSKKYKLERFNRPPAVTIAHKNGQAVVELTAVMHPVERRMFNCYYFHVILVYWLDKDNDCVHAGKKTSWISQSDELLTFDINFPVPDEAKEYVLFVRQVRGKDKKEEGLLPERGMMLVSVGSFDEEGQKKLEAFRLRKEELRLEKLKGGRKVVVEEERVEPRRVVSSEL